MNPQIRLKQTSSLFLVAVVLACFALSPQARADCRQGCDDANGNTFLGESAGDGGGNNTAIGFQALSFNTGSFNTATGYFTLVNNIGDGNTATGSEALFNNSTGNHNTSTGAGALFSNTSGSENTANGDAALYNNAQGSNNTATGSQALFRNLGNNNTAAGFQALLENTSGHENTATGEGALQNNTIGNFNTATGHSALLSNTTGVANTANGEGALVSNTTGGNNTANGAAVLVSNTSGSFNTATGESALSGNTIGHDNLAEGYSALDNNTTGSSNIAIGSQAGANLTTGSNNIDIGANVLGVAGEAKTIRIGKSGTQTKTFIAGINGATVANGVGVIVGTTGQLGTVQSSKRFKEAIEPMDKTSEAILALKPVTFRYKKELDPDRIPQFGLVAEDVEKVNPDLVVRNENGDLSSVRYEAVNAMLLNEFLKEHKAVQQQGGTIARLEKQLETVIATLQKVSAQLELNKSAPQTVQNNR